MSLVFGFPNTQGVKVSEHLSSQGINLLRCSLSDYEVLVCVHSYQPAYRQYVNYLPAYMAATVNQTKTTITNPYHPLQYKNTQPLIPVVSPDIIISFPSVPASDILEAIRSAGGRDVVSQRSSAFILPSPSPDLIRNFVNSGASRQTPAYTGTVNIDCLATISLLRRILSNFFITHTYPAFKDRDHLEITEKYWPITTNIAQKRKADSSSQEPPAKKIQTVAGSVAAESAVDVNMDDTSTDRPPPSEKILYAVPTPQGRDGWGNFSDLPTGEGFFIRFIEDSQSFETEKTVPNIINRYFMGCLGTNAGAVKDMFNRIRTDMGLIKRTVTGKQLAHLFKCIDIGLQAQARIFPLIIDGEYHGCVLSGAGFVLTAYGSSYTPVIYSTLQDKVEVVGSTASILFKIAEIVTTDTTDSDHRAVVVSETMQELRQAVRGAALTQDEREQIVGLAKRLRFRPYQLNVSHLTLSRAFQAIADRTLPADFPIHYTMLFEENLNHVIWSVFGSLAPTCRFVGGPLVDLTKSNPAAHIGFRQIPLKDALIDLDETLSQKTFPTVSLNRRSGPFKDRLYKGTEGRQIIQSLISAAGVAHASAKAAKENTRNTLGDSSVLDEGF